MCLRFIPALLCYVLISAGSSESLLSIPPVQTIECPHESDDTALRLVMACLTSPLGPEAYVPFAEDVCNETAAIEQRTGTHITVRLYSADDPDSLAVAAEGITKDNVDTVLIMGLAGAYGPLLTDLSLTLLDALVHGQSPRTGESLPRGASRAPAGPAPKTPVPAPRLKSPTHMSPKFPAQWVRAVVPRPSLTPLPLSQAVGPAPAAPLAAKFQVLEDITGTADCNGTVAAIGHALECPHELGDAATRLTVGLLISPLGTAAMGMFTDHVCNETAAILRRTDTYLAVRAYFASDSYR